jgi:hypothetical protein
MNKTTYTMKVVDHLGETKSGLDIYLVQYNDNLTKVLYSSREHKHLDEIEVARFELINDKPIFRKD